MIRCPFHATYEDSYNDASSDSEEPNQKTEGGEVEPPNTIRLQLFFNDNWKSFTHTEFGISRFASVTETVLDNLTWGDFTHILSTKHPINGHLFIQSDDKTSYTPMEHTIKSKTLKELGIVNNTIMVDRAYIYSTVVKK